MLLNRFLGLPYHSPNIFGKIHKNCFLIFALLLLLSFWGNLTIVSGESSDNLNTSHYLIDENHQMVVNSGNIIWDGTHFYGIDSEGGIWESEDKKAVTEEEIPAHLLNNLPAITQILIKPDNPTLLEDTQGNYYDAEGTEEGISQLTDSEREELLSTYQRFSPQMEINNGEIPLQNSFTKEENKDLRGASQQEFPFFQSVSPLDTPSSRAFATSLPEEWQWKYLGYLGADPNALAPNGNGKTLLECYQQGEDPRKSIPGEFNQISLIVEEPLYANTYTSLEAKVHENEKDISKVVFCFKTKDGHYPIIGVVTQPPYEIDALLPEGNFDIVAVAQDKDDKNLCLDEKNITVKEPYYYFRGPLVGNGLYAPNSSDIISNDLKVGVALDGVEDFGSIFGDQFPWFLRVSTGSIDPVNYFDADTTSGEQHYSEINKIPFLDGTKTGDQPPMVAFGSEAGGDPLYAGENYHFTLSPGALLTQVSHWDMRIEVFDKKAFLNGKTCVKPIKTQGFKLPQLTTSDWNEFNKKRLVGEYNVIDKDKDINFTTKIEYANDYTLNGFPQFFVTHRASNDKYYYHISMIGGMSDYPSVGKMTALAGNSQSKFMYNLCYTLDFQTPGPWRTHILETPNFQGIPLPSQYQGKSLEELCHYSPQVKDKLPDPDQISLDLKTVDNSPELKSHPVLDQLVNDLGKDPLVIANYVLNEIELTDALGFDSNSKGGDQEDGTDDRSATPPGVSRDALATYLEGEGSPTEQCALLVYMLRKAGYPAAYVFPEYNSTTLLDQQLSRLLKIQLKGALIGTLPSFLRSEIPINYPWVITYVDGHWRHVFPWMKDTEIKEGKNLWDYFPSGYNTAGQWVMKYLLNDPNIRNLSDKDNLAPLFKEYAKQQLAKVGLSLEDVGLRAHNRHHHYIRWEDFPRPWKTPLITEKRVAKNLDVTQNPQELAPVLQDIFDTISLEIFSPRAANHPKPTEQKNGTENAQSNNDKLPQGDDPDIKTGTMRLVDLHNRRIFLYHQVVPNSQPQKFRLILSLEAYDSSTGSKDLIDSHTFYQGTNPDPGILRNHQEVSTLLQTTNDNKNDDLLLFKIHYERHRSAQDDIKREEEDGSLFWTQLPFLGETTTIDDTRFLHKGDAAVLSLNYGRVTQRMEDFEADKYYKYQKYLLQSEEKNADPEMATGQLLHLMGNCYYHKLSEASHFIHEMTKTTVITEVAHGFVKLSPQRDNKTGNMVIENGKDIKLVYPNVDMSYQEVTTLGNSSNHLESGKTHLEAKGASQLWIGEGSADEHVIINEFFQQKNAISTVKLLDLSQGWDSKTQKAAHPGTGVIVLNTKNYLQQAATKSGDNQPTLQQKLTQAGLWNNIKETLTNVKDHNRDQTTVVVTPNPISSSTQPGCFKGMGAMVFASDYDGAFISENMIPTHGGSGEPLYTPIQEYNPPAQSVTDGYLAPTDNGGYTYTQPSSTGNNTQSYDARNYNYNFYEQLSGSNQQVYNDDNYDEASSWYQDNSGAYDTSTDWGYVSSSDTATQGDTSYYSGGGNNQSYSNSGNNSGQYIDSSSGGYNDNYYEGNSGSYTLWNSPVNVPSTYHVNPSDAPVVQPKTNLSPQGKAVAEVQRQIYNHGDTGTTTYYGSSTESQQGGFMNFVADPVNVMTGEFYINALDLKLYGPMPLEIHRSYSSQNKADNNFGKGWKLSYFPYLTLSEDKDKIPGLIHAAEQDGSVVAYRYQPSLEAWVPTTVDNPSLTNISDGTSLSSPNLFNNRITRKEIDGVWYYYLVGSDGSLRTFKVESFPTDEEHGFVRERPYLQKWQDGSGNYYLFDFGRDKDENDWGLLNLIRSSNGDTIKLNYDTKGHIKEAVTSDGRFVNYQYDPYGDLSEVNLPDGSFVKYQYQHQKRKDGSTYSTHLIIEEEKPEGRLLQNKYDDQGRVGSQLATVGTSPTPVVNATFNYQSKANPDRTVSGKTVVTDINKNNTTYTYSNSNITRIDYPSPNKGSTPLTTTQEWYDGKNGFPRSVKQRKDKRGLVTSYQYDERGNLLNKTLSGDLTGNGGQEQAITSMSYNARNQLISVINPLGHKINYEYKDSYTPYLPTRIQTEIEGKIVNEVAKNYTNIQQKHREIHGLLSQENNNGAITHYEYDNKGFLASKTLETGTHDGNVKVEYQSNRQGDIISAKEMTGTVTHYDYDSMDRLTGKEIYDPSGNLIDWHYNYYNGNGEVTWQQGAHYNPVDYTYDYYDFAGHIIEHTTWLAQAAQDGSSIVSGGTATTFSSFDGYGNLMKQVDPQGVITQFDYDGLGNMLHKKVLGEGNKVIRQEAFTYEPGGLVATHTTALGAIEKESYTSTGLLKSSTRADGTVTSSRYDLLGRVVQETLPNGSFWKTVYDDASHTRTHAFYDSSGKFLGSEITHQDARGNIIEQTDLMGHKTTKSYDNLNRVKELIGPEAEEHTAQQHETYSYDPTRSSVASCNALGETSLTFKDSLGRITWDGKFDSNGISSSSTTYSYSFDQNYTSCYQGSPGNMIFTITGKDFEGNPLIKSYADGRNEITRYDKNGNKIYFKDQNQITTEWSYDTLNHPTEKRIVDNSGNSQQTTQYHYDVVGNLLEKTLPSGLTESHHYDQAGRKTSDSFIDLDGKETQKYNYTYATTGNGAGLISSISDPRGGITHLTYDAQGNITERVSQGGSIKEQNQTVNSSYDLLGNLLSSKLSFLDPTTGKDSLVKRSYNSYNQLVREQTFVNGNKTSDWEQNWDQAGRRQSLSSLLGGSDSIQYQYSYNASGLMTGVKTDRHGSCQYDYWDNGLLQTRNTPYLNQTYYYDSAGKERAVDSFLKKAIQRQNHFLENLAWKDKTYLLEKEIAGVSGSNFLLRNGTYEYDVLGRVTQETIYDKGSSFQPKYGFGLDYTHQNDFEKKGKDLRTYQYFNDNYINRVSNISSLQQITGDHCAWKNNFVERANSYDQSGELIKRELDHEGQQVSTEDFTWDSLGHLVGWEGHEAANQDGDQETHWEATYDALGRRLQTVYQSSDSSPKTINYYYDPSVEFMELGHHISDEGVTWNLYGPDKSGVYGGAQGIGGLEAISTSSGGTMGKAQNYGIINNYFGDTVGKVSAENGLEASNVSLGGYGPLGYLAFDEEMKPQWKDHYLDPTGLYYFGARYYDPIVGRFISPDPLGIGENMSLYDYCGNDPINNLDPDGRLGKGVGKGAIKGGFAHYDNLTQMAGGFIGEGLDYVDPFTIPFALSRDISAAGYYTAKAAINIYHEGLNWSNGTELAASGVGVFVGGKVIAREGIEIGASWVRSASQKTEALQQGVDTSVNWVKNAVGKSNLGASEFGEEGSSLIKPTQPEQGNYHDKPPGWSDKWDWNPSTRARKHQDPWRWHDPEGGEWRRHEFDKYHPSHWDYNPNDTWNSKWKNIDNNGKLL